MTKSELKQKLEAVRDERANKTSAYYDGVNKKSPDDEFPGQVGVLCYDKFSEGFDSLLPLLLDAYEALDKVSAVAVCRVITPKEEHGQMLDNCLNISEEPLARIEAFANGEEK